MVPVPISGRTQHRKVTFSAIAAIAAVISCDNAAQTPQHAVISPTPAHQLTAPLAAHVSVGADRYVFTNDSPQAHSFFVGSLSSGAVIEYRLPNALTIHGKSVFIAPDDSSIAILAHDGRVPYTAYSATRLKLLVIKPNGKILYTTSNDRRTYSNLRYASINQIVYWSDVSHLPGWLYNTSDEDKPAPIYALYVFDTRERTESILWNSVQRTLSTDENKSSDTCPGRKEPQLLPNIFMFAAPFEVITGSERPAILMRNMFNDPLKLRCWRGHFTSSPSDRMIPEEQNKYVRVNFNKDNGEWVSALSSPPEQVTDSVTLLGSSTESTNITYLRNGNSLLLGRPDSTVQSIYRFPVEQTAIGWGADMRNVVLYFPASRIFERLEIVTTGKLDANSEQISISRSILSQTDPHVTIQIEE